MRPTSTPFCRRTTFEIFFFYLSRLFLKSHSSRVLKKKRFFFSQKKKPFQPPSVDPLLQLRHKTIVYDFFSLVFYTYITPSPMLGESKNKFVTVRNSRFQRVVVQHWGVRFNPERIFFF